MQLKDELVFVQWTNNYGGIEKITAFYENELKDFFTKVYVLQKKQEGIKYQAEVSSLSKSNIFLTYLAYFFFVLRNKEAIFHLQYAGTKILVVTYLAGARKIVYHFHGTKFSSNRIEKIIWTYLSSKIHIIANSTYIKFLIEDRFKIFNNVSLIPNLIDLEKFKFINKSVNSKFIITFAGRFTKGKNVDKIVKTAKILKNRKDLIEFRLYGDGIVKKDIQSMIIKEKLDDFVKLFGFTNDIVKVYNEANIFLFLSEYESFGNVVAEAMLTGTPVLCYRIPALEDLIKDDYFFVNSFEPDNIKSKILMIIKNYNIALEKVQIENKFLRNYLDKSKITKSLKTIYSTL